MRRRRFLVHIVALAGLPIGLAACAKPERPLAVGVLPWVGYEPLYLAREFGWLPPGIALVEGKTAGDSIEGLKAGRLDAAALTLDEALVARAAGVPLRIVAVLDASAGSDMLLARPGIRTLADLKGQRIAVEHSAVGSIVLLKALEAAGLSKNDVTAVNVPLSEQVAAWQSGSIDAAITYEPTASRLMRLGAMRLFDSRRMPETIFDVLAVRADRASPKAVRGLVEAHFKGLDHIRINRQDAVYRIAARQGVSPEEVQRALAGVVLSGVTGNRRYLAKESRFMQTAQMLETLMVREGLLPKADGLGNLIDASHLPNGQQ